MEAKDTKIIIGLTIEEVVEIKRKNQVNYDPSVQTKSIKRILALLKRNKKSHHSTIFSYISH